MSLILVTRFNEGIVLASDSFIFDNDSEVPSKHMSFEKILVSNEHKMAMVAVGSSWVFHQAEEWLKAQFPSEDIAALLSKKWKSLNAEWKADREREISESNDKTLRPVSDSVLVIARQDTLNKILIIDPKGELHTSETFVISGSGADIARGYLKAYENSGWIFRSSDTLEESLKILKNVYKAASHDLYVTGFPNIAIVTKEEISDYSAKCKEAWAKSVEVYWGSILFGEVKS